MPADSCRRRLVPCLAAAAVVLGLAACGGGSNARPSVSSGSVAAVGDQQISRAQFAALLATSRSSYAQQNRPFPKPGTAAYAKIRDEIVQVLVERAEFEQKAKSDLGIQITDKQVEARRAQIVKENFGGSEQKYEQELAREHLSDAAVRHQIRTQLIQEAITRKVTANVAVDDAAIARYYRSHRSQFRRPESRDVRHILVKTKAEAERIERQLAHGADFAALARKYSLDTGTKSLGGRFQGGIQRGRTVPAFDKVAFSLRTNEISAPVHSPYGWHVIQALTPVIPAGTTPLSQVRATIKQQLLQQKDQAALTKWAADVKKEFASKVAYAAGYAPSRQG